MQEHLLDWIKEVMAKEMPMDELGEKYPLASHPANLTLIPESKRPR